MLGCRSSHLYVHADPGGRIQFWRCTRCRKHKLQVVNSGETVYAESDEQDEEAEARAAATTVGR